MSKYFPKFCVSHEVKYREMQHYGGKVIKNPFILVFLAVHLTTPREALAT